MDDGSLHHPHDKLFAAAFGVPENTAALLKATIPSAIASKLDWEAMLPLPGSFVDTHYERSHSDLLFSVPFAGREVLLYVLFEHQSTRDPWLSLRLLRYFVRIWEGFLRARPDAENLPPILPVVLSQNGQTWEPAAGIADLLDLPGDLAEALHPYIPDFAHIHLQLAEMAFEEIPGTPAGVLVLRAMKAERLGRLLDDPVWDDDLLVEVPREIFQMVLRYILGADIDRRSFEDRIDGLSNPQIRTEAMTLAQVYRQEGRQEGLRNSVVEALELRFGIVPVGLREVIDQVSDEARLHALHRSAIQCESLESFAKGI